PGHHSLCVRPSPPSPPAPPPTPPLSLHDALPISRYPSFWTGAERGYRMKGRGLLPRRRRRSVIWLLVGLALVLAVLNRYQEPLRDRKSTRLNSSHVKISYAVFCLKKKSSSGVGAT